MPRLGYFDHQKVASGHISHHCLKQLNLKTIVRTSGNWRMKQSPKDTHQPPVITAPPSIATLVKCGRLTTQ
ncbi:hypothetical protein EYC84_011577 [Monilinia fructicola]|uniref:Uncharacterized protein n=1 Tax=Monilinia fructicola TaxID=38448 RepID=A0A5M9J806_MONFR|nr:hypothetical protein EYC84_011577 [Monilinia fructicola]